MPPSVVEKPPLPGAPPATLEDYAAVRAGFSWAQARAELEGLPGGALNIAHEAVWRHAAGPGAERVAFRFLARKGPVRDVTWRELRGLCARFANLLESLGVARGERVFTLLGRVPELYVSVLGTLARGAVLCPLFAAFGPEPVRSRLEIGNGRVLVTTPALYEQKVASIRARLPELRHVLLLGEPAEVARHPDCLDLRLLLEQQAAEYAPARTAPEDMALLHFTSGTTGKPKGAVHVHQAVVAHHVTGRWALDLHPGDVYWCTADPGWVTGISYGVIAPLTNGVTSVVDEADFNPERWYRILQEQGVEVWYTAPTAVRMMMRAGEEAARPFDLSALRFVASVGEPLNPEAVFWGLRALGRPIHDNWWQTETGGIMIANLRSQPIRPGSMGLPLPGVEAAIVRKAAAGGLEVAPPGQEGELALRPGWPSMFRAYLHEDERYRRCFVDGWYLTGDLARRDADGWFWFVGRADDIIKTSGHMVSPFEVESALLEHPAVAEAGVIGKPDPLAGELVKAFVALKPGREGDEALKKELLAHARVRLGAAVAPKELAFLPGLPRTRSGKIMRRLLRARELGLPEGDTSTLESDR